MKNRDILKKLNSKQKKQFITNCKRNQGGWYYTFMRKETHCLGYTLASSFNWLNSNQGHTYWRTIANSINEQPYNY